MRPLVIDDGFTPKRKDGLELGDEDEVTDGNCTESAELAEISNWTDHIHKQIFDYVRSHPQNRFQVPN